MTRARPPAQARIAVRSTQAFPESARRFVRRAAMALAVGLAAFGGAHAASLADPLEPLVLRAFERPDEALAERE
jgi:hypothetical protein